MAQHDERQAMKKVPMMAAREERRAAAKAKGDVGYNLGVYSYKTG